MRACLYCSVDISAKKSDAIYCSRGCRDKAMYGYRKCLYCELPLTNPRLDSKTKYCSRTCQNAAQVQIGPRSPVYFPACRGCGAVFASRSPRVKLCSMACQVARKKHLLRRAYSHKPWYQRKPNQQGQCVICGNTFISHSITRRLCSSCKQRRSVDPETRRLIADRDGWHCHLCKRVVAWADATADHVVPRSVGGTNALTNLRLAHRSRGAGRTPGQLVLV